MDFINKIERLRGEDSRLTQVKTAVERVAAAKKINAVKLDLSGLGLKEVPASIGELTQLQHLDLSTNELTAVPEEVSRLTQLQDLELSSNKLAVLPEALECLTRLQNLSIADNRLAALPEALGHWTQLQTLIVSNNRLTALPKAIGELRQLQTLIVSDNQLTALPEEIGELSQLQILIAANNRLAALPQAVGRLAQLQTLSVSNNQLTALPESVGDLARLQALIVSSNRITVLPSSLGQLAQLQDFYASNNCVSALPQTMRQLSALQRLALHKNDGLGLPPEVLGPAPGENDFRSKAANPAKIFEYYFSKRVSKPLNEAKMILVGRGGVGKTSLVNRLVHRRYSPTETKTDGIAITAWHINAGRDRVRLNIWDFGGQEIMHATHQFFLTKRSLYLLVLNAREGEQDANVEYWLRLIESFGADSPVLVVINKIKDHPFDLNRRGLRAKFPSIRGFLQTDCDSDIGIDELRQAIERETDWLPHLRDPFPAAWFNVKDALANLPISEGCNFIPFARYRQLCQEHGITEATSQETLVSFLHDLGIVVNFRDDPRLAETHVLDPEWVTRGIYKILNAETLAHKHGELRLADLDGVLDAGLYPREMRLYLLDLMRKFELCYEFYETGHYLVPELLGKEEPDLQDFAGADAMRFEYTYNIVPEGLLPRFIVRSRALNKNLPRWRSGVILEWEGNRAAIKADVQDRRVSITITGPLAGRRRLLSVIRADMEYLHYSIARLQVNEHVPVPGFPQLAVDYETLRVLEAAGQTDHNLVHNGRVVRVRIDELLNGIDERSLPARDFRRETPHPNTLQVAFSYSHKDEELRDQLETHLKLLQRQGAISTWHDRKILGGENWEGVIDDNFKRADLILLLVSADFLASDYCHEIEMQTALQRAASGEARVVPVIVRACAWETDPLAALQALPQNGRAVTSWSNRDEAWNNVARGMQKIIENIRLSRIGKLRPASAR